MPPTARRALPILALSLALACSRGSPEPTPAAPPWESAWQVEHGPALREHPGHLHTLKG